MKKNEPEKVKKCDNKCSGMWFEKDGRVLMIERKKYNPGWAMPAGHLDGLSAEETAKKESAEEVGLLTEKMERVYEEILPNTCKRENGTHHEWHIFKILDWSGELKACEEEVNKMEWKSREEIAELTKKLQDFASDYGLSLTLGNLAEIVAKTNVDEAWKKSPGLEPPMYFIFKALKLI